MLGKSDQNKQAILLQQEDLQTNPGKALTSVSSLYLNMGRWFILIAVMFQKLRKSHLHPTFRAF